MKPTTPLERMIADLVDDAGEWCRWYSHIQTGREISVEFTHRESEFAVGAQDIRNNIFYIIIGDHLHFFTSKTLARQWDTLCAGVPGLRLTDEVEKCLAEVWPVT